MDNFKREKKLKTHFEEKPFLMKACCQFFNRVENLYSIHQYGIEQYVRHIYFASLL